MTLSAFRNSGAVRVKQFATCCNFWDDRTWRLCRLC